MINQYGSAIFSFIASRMLCINVQQVKIVVLNHKKMSNISNFGSNFFYCRTNPTGVFYFGDDRIKCKGGTLLIGIREH